MRRLFALGVVAAVAVVYGLVLFAAPASADIPFFSAPAGGLSGTFTSPGAEPYLWNYPSGTGMNWGSPGVSQGVTPYSEAIPAYGFEISFDHGGSAIDTSTFTFPGSPLDCTGTLTGGTVFCSNPGTGYVTWTPVSLGAATMEFLAPSGTLLDPGQSYFGNIFLSSEAGQISPTGAFLGAFSGTWLTVPEPGTMSMFGMGMSFLGLGLIRFRKVA